MADEFKLSGSVKITKDDTKKIFARVRELNNSVTAIGFFEDGPQYSQEYQPPVATVAQRNEYGWRQEDGADVPARPFFRPAIDKFSELIGNKILEAATKVAFQGGDLGRALGSQAQLMRLAIQRNILSNTPPPLSGSWDPPRGYLGEKRLLGQPARTLVATYTMLRAVGWKVFGGSGQTLSKSQPNAQSAGDEA